MTGRLVVISGTGTGIGKTHVAEAILLALGARGLRAAGVKPVETGYVDAACSDAARLARASSFHVKHSGARFADPVSPHVAAREAGVTLCAADLAADVADCRPQVDLLLAELAGGLFSPLSDVETNADFTKRLRPDIHLLLAVDRLGVLHDLIATTRAAAATPLPIDGVVLVAPQTPDSSTGRNAAEIPRLLAVPIIAVLPRAPTADLARSRAIATVVDRLLPEASSSGSR